MLFFKNFGTNPKILHEHEKVKIEKQEQFPGLCKKNKIGCSSEYHTEMWKEKFQIFWWRKFTKNFRLRVSFAEGQSKNKICQSCMENGVKMGTIFCRKVVKFKKWRIYSTVLIHALLWTSSKYWMIKVNTINGHPNFLTRSKTLKKRSGVSKLIYVETDVYLDGSTHVATHTNICIWGRYYLCKSSRSLIPIYPSTNDKLASLTRDSCSMHSFSENDMYGTFRLIQNCLLFPHLHFCRRESSLVLFWL